MRFHNNFNYYSMLEYPPTPPSPWWPGSSLVAGNCIRNEREPKNCIPHLFHLSRSLLYQTAGRRGLHQSAPHPQVHDEEPWTQRKVYLLPRLPPCWATAGGLVPVSRWPFLQDSFQVLSDDNYTSALTAQTVPWQIILLVLSEFEYTLSLLVGL